MIKFPLFLLYLLSFNLSFAQGGFVGAPVRQIDQETLNLLERLQKELNISPNSSRIDCGSNSTDKCEFTQICNKFRQNRNSKSLYENSKGQIIPNFKLLNLQEMVDQCRSRVSASSVTAENPLTYMEKLYKKKRKAFLDSVQTHNEEATIVKLELAMVNASFEKADDPNSNSWFMTRDEIKKNISDAEVKTGVRLSDDSKTKWIDLLDQTSGATMPKSIAQTNIGSSDNPFLKNELLTDINVAGSKEKVRGYQAQFQKELNRSFDIFKDTRTHLIAVLNKRKNGKNDAEINNMISRISNIKMNPPEISSSSNPFGSTCSSPNAFYDPMSHTFTLCPQLLQMPSSTIQIIIAHELGHSIDPCIATYPMVKMEGTQKPNPYAAYLGNKKNQQKMDEQMGRVMFEPTLPDQGQEKFAAFDTDYLKNSMSNSYDNLTISEKQKSIGIVKNPFSSAIQCLQSKHSVGARIGDVGGAKSAVKKKISDLRKSGATNTDPRIKELNETLERIDSVYADKKACSFMGSNGGLSQMQEAFSDWIASEVIANKIATAPNRQEAQQIAFEANGFFAALDCRSFDLDIAETAASTLEKAGCQSRGSRFMEDLGNMAKHEDPHPESYNRINKIFMANPKVADALSCKKVSGVKYCE